ncbi:putative serine/threonine-kinase GCN2-like protein, partial [Trifolium medium]|nr:putative serine/threonine-kinase GCN2-like protein [Trifolium medium]
YFIVDEYTTEDNKGMSGSESTESLSSASSPHHQEASQTIEKDLMMVHMLRLVCASKGTLANSLPQLATELYNLGV